jgi:hypothetical protein
MHNHTITAEYIHSREDNYMIKLEVELESIGCIVSHHPSAKGRGTYSSAHSFSFRICSSSSDEKLFVNFFIIRGWIYVLVLDVEEFSDLFWGFTLDHVGYGLASDVATCQLPHMIPGKGSSQERLDVEVAVISYVITEGKVAHLAAKMISNNIS